MNLKTSLQFGLIAILFSLSACRPGGGEYISDFDVVGTAYTKDIDFKTRKTYAMWDTIVEVGSGEPDQSVPPDYIPQNYANMVTAEIDRNMKANGWTKVGRDQNPDAFVQNAVMSTTYTYYYYSYYYYGWYYPYGGWYYPGYYPPTYSSTTTGSLLMLLVDGKETSPAGKAPVLWVGVINGLMEGSTSSFASRVTGNIGQAFKQSPILKR